jgi:hypothetical protein
MQFEHPFTAIIAGPTGSGKTQLVKNILLNAKTMINPPPHRIIWYYSEWQEELASALASIQIEWVQGTPSIEDFTVGGSRPILVIVDDQMLEAGKKMSDLFTKGSHHRNLSVFFLVQNFFEKNQRTVSLNAQYVVFFKNPRSKSQFSFLARDMYPDDWRFLVDAYNDATAPPHGYLMIDLKQGTSDYLRCLTNILPDQRTAVYVSKKTALLPAFQSFVVQSW